MHIAHRPTRRNCRTILWRWRCELRITMSRYRWSFRSAESNSSIHVTTAKSARTEEARIRLRSFRHRFRLQMLASRRWKASTVSIHYACINAIKLRSNQLAGMGFALTVTRQRFLLSISVTRGKKGEAVLSSRLYHSHRWNNSDGVSYMLSNWWPLHWFNETGNLIPQPFVCITRSST